MTPPSFDVTTLTIDSGLAPRSARSGERRYLLVVEGGTSRVVTIPERGELVIGRAPECAVRLEDRAASRHHARIAADGAEVMLVDLGSHNGTELNGERLTAPRSLARADVIGIGETSIVVHRERQEEEVSRVDERELRRRVDRAIVEGARDPSMLAVACVRFEPTVERRRIDAVPLAKATAAVREPRDLLVLLSDLEEEPERTIERLLDASALRELARAGVATYPTDGGDADALFDAARCAMDAAALGEVARAEDLPATRSIGGRSVLVVEPAMVRIYALLERLAKSTLPVLVTGATGTGKEHASAVLHYASPRANGPFVTINCAALPEALVESELFGHERGAFSGAVAAKAGRFEAASGGTLFLDELGELSLATQAKVLRAIETQRITRVGAVDERAIDVRFVAATHRDLAEEVRAGRFRQDLLFRLGAATVALPPLRDRRRELPALARALLAEACARSGRAPLSLAPLSVQKLLAHAWPGNVRELKNAMEYAAATAEGSVVEPWDLPTIGDGAAEVTAPRPSSPPATGSAPPRTGFRPLADELRELEKRRILEALAAAGGVQARAAELIGMPVRTLFAKLKLYGIAPRAPSRDASASS